MMSKRLILALGLSLMGSAAFADMTVQLGGGWDGRKVPAGQHCHLSGGKGSTPPMTVSGIPAGTVWLIAYYNDKSYSPLSQNGGHGTIGYPVKGATADLPAVPGMTAKLPGGVRVIKPARATGDYASPGYLPPCSGGRGNRYTVDIRAVDASGKVLSELKNVDIGKY